MSSDTDPHPASPVPGAPPGTAPGRRLADAGPTLALACAGVFVVILDATIVSVALPRIATDLHFAPVSLAWVVNAYTLAFAGALLVAGQLVASYGTRVTFLAGVGCFGAASLACGLAPASGVLIAARALQGLGGAVVMPATLTMVATAYHNAALRTRALALWSAIGAAGAAAGTVAGGVLTDTVGWRWVFLVNVPITAVAALAALRVIAPARQRARRSGLDLPGAVLATAGLVAVVYGILGCGTDGWNSAPVLAALCAGAVCVSLFTVHQHRWAQAPLVPLSLFRSKPLSAANAVIFFLGLGFFASPVLLSIYLQDIHGYSPLRAGLAFLPAAAALFTGAQVAGRLTHRHGIRVVATGGALIAAVGFAWLTRLDALTAYWPGILMPQILFGLGIGIAFTPITVAATTVAPEQAGIAAGILNTVRQVAAALGLAILTALVTSHHSSNSSHGYDRAFLIAACSALIAAAGAATLLPHKPERPIRKA
jgi:EmrB/QacA subfamily drug resistance transporter